ncbi:MAG: acetylxylan esterase [Verrucomicrobiales bacterium]|nr:acetylxylan esterase [Verrucomicrobiales bacterium]
MKLIRISIFALAFAVSTHAEEAVVTLHDYHPFRPVPSISQWKDRKEEIQTRILVAAGLLPMPEKTPLNAKRFGTVKQDGFKVERVYFESFPGHFVTGNLFSPDGETEANGLVDGKRPGVICPHGHWTNGRFYDSIDREGYRGALAQIAKGAERFEAASRNPIIARCVQLARMGCVVLVFDTIGNADSMQLVEHRRGPRDAMNGKEAGEWGLVSPQATLRLQTNFGLQTWNSVRALDYLASLEEVDPDRILVTGASGGATQTMMLSAIDDRVDASFPAVMVSTAMQGGCTCENSHYLRIGQGNVDIAAAFAPKPLGLTAADDWTIELETKGHPDLQSLYERLKAPGNYEAYFDIHFFHNFNHVSRTHLYEFVNRHFNLGFGEPVLESDFKFLGREDLGVWDALDEKPENYVAGDEHEKALNAIWAADSDAAIAEDRKALKAGWGVLLNASALPTAPAAFELGEKEKADGVVKMSGSISFGERSLPAEIHYPENWNGEVVVHTAGDASGYGDAAVVIPSLSRGVNQAVTYSGEKDLPSDSWQRSPVYFYGYNDSNFTRRAHEVAAAVSMAANHPDWEVTKITVQGEGDTAATALAARFLSGDEIDELLIDLKDFRFADVTDFDDDNMVPGALKYGDVEGLGKVATQ